MSEILKLPLTLDPLLYSQTNAMNGRAIIAVISFFITSAVESASWTSEEVEEQRQILGRISVEAAVRRRRQLDPELRAAIIQLSRAKAESAEPNYREQYYRTMFDLGDEATVERYAREFIAGDTSNSSGFTTSQNPRLIALIAPAIFRNEGELVPQQNKLSQSIETSLCILEILGTTPDFSSEVINWARRLPPQRETWYDLRQVMREWWRENERFFKEGNYQAVKPGRELVKEEPKVEPPPAPPAAIATSPFEQLSPPSASPSVASAAESSPSSNWPLWTAAAAAVALLAGLVFFWKRRA